MKAKATNAHVTRIARTYCAITSPSAAPTPSDPTIISSARTALPGITAPLLASGRVMANTTTRHTAAATVCRIVTFTMLRDSAPRAPTSRIRAHVTVGDATAANVPSTRATVSASRNG